jgi:hypothetical protein
LIAQACVTAALRRRFSEVASYDGDASGSGCGRDASAVMSRLPGPTEHVVGAPGCDALGNAIVGGTGRRSQGTRVLARPIAARRRTRNHRLFSITSSRAPACRQPLRIDPPRAGLTGFAALPRLEDGDFGKELGCPGAYLIPWHYGAPKWDSRRRAGPRSACASLPPPP